MIMKLIPAAIGLAFCAGVGVASAGPSNPTELSAAKMDSVTAGGLLNIAPQTNVGPQANLNVLGFGVKQSNTQSNSSGGYDKGGHGGKHGGNDKHASYGKHGGYDKGGHGKGGGYDKGGHGKGGGYDKGGHGKVGNGKHGGGYDGSKWCKKDGRGGDYGNHGGNKHGGAGGKNTQLVNFAPQTNVGPQANVNVLGFKVAQSNTQSNRN
jgi:hypothetical protein